MTDPNDMKRPNVIVTRFSGVAYAVAVTGGNPGPSANELRLQVPTGTAISANKRTSLRVVR